MNRLSAILHPDIYHGRWQKPPFFEGWYYKLISASEEHRYAVIPGVFLGANGHAFIQVLNGSTGSSAYHRFPLSDFWASKDRFEVRIGENEFSRERIRLRVDDENGSVRGELKFRNAAPWPVTLFSPGIMGPYAWAPFMECYHGVVSLDHTMEGQLCFNDLEIDFTHGTGYTEKDWGQSFPSGYIWFQSNHFDQPHTCITASIANIPWLWSSFPGFIIGFWQSGKLVRFASYTGAKIEKLELDGQKIDWVLKDKHYRLELLAARTPGGKLLGPDRIEMGKRVDETLLASVQVRLSTLAGKTIFSGMGRNAGLETHGELEGLLVQP